jgi:hypothetical protein
VTSHQIGRVFVHSARRARRRSLPTQLSRRTSPIGGQLEGVTVKRESHLRIV